MTSQPVQTEGRRRETPKARPITLVLLAVACLLVAMAVEWAYPRMLRAGAPAMATVHVVGVVALVGFVVLLVAAALRRVTLRAR